MNLSNDSFLRMVGNLHEGLYFVDRNIRITYWNKAAQQISGFSAAEVVGRPCSDNILTHMDAEGNPLCFGGCPLRKTIEDGRPREAQIYMHHKDGHRVPVSVKASVLTDAGGKVIGGIELFTEVSKHWASQELMNPQMMTASACDPRGAGELAAICGSINFGRRK